MSWIERAKVGDKVVYVVPIINLFYGPPPLVLNQVYEISEILPMPLRDDFGVQLRGIFCEAPYGFNSERFRPVRDTTTQVEALKRNCLGASAKSPEVVG